MRQTDRMSTGWVVLACVLLAAEAFAEEPWPRWRGSDFNGTSREADVFPADGFALDVRWRRGLGSGYSGIAVSDGHVVTMFSDGQMDYVVCLGADGGQEHWRLPIAATYPGREGANDGPVSTPAIADGTVIALGPRGDLLAVELETGMTLWRVHLVEEFGSIRPHWGFGTSPLVVGGRVFVATGGRDGAVTAFDRKTGAVHWSAGSDEVNYQSPILWTRNQAAQLLAAGDTKLFAIDPMSGDELWSYAHGGSGFFEKIVTPVIVGESDIFVTHSPGGSKLLGLEHTPEDTVELREQWESSHLKLNYAAPIVHEGNLYGFSRNFLASVDARTGALNWKSRPPGNGFHILVDGHLVILTKAGSLHVVEATSEAYRELARLDVTPHITWTPPSFADGRIYVRDSFADVVAIDVITDGARSTEAAPSDERIADGAIAGTRFSSWIASIETAPDKDDRIREYLAAQPRIPIIEDDRFAHVIYQAPESSSPAGDVVLRGGMLGAKNELSMPRVPGTHFYHASFELAADARIQYQFVPNLDNPVTDPLNPLVSDSLVYPGEVSLLVMPEAEVPKNPDSSDATTRGAIESLPFETETVQVGRLSWGGERPVSVYLPPGYDPASAERYPSVYILYGEHMLDSARLDRVLDGLVGGAIEPVVAVFVAATSGYEYARSQRGEHARMVVEELVPRIDAAYRTDATAERRAIVGVGEAAFAALDIAFGNPRTFGKIGAQSPLAIGKGGDELARMIADSPVQPKTIYLDWGRYDHSNDATETDIPRYSRELREQLTERGYTVTGREWNDSSDAAIWAWRAPAMFTALFPRAPGSQNANRATRVELDSARFRYEAQEHRIEQHLGRTSLRLQGGTAILEDVAFTDGTIELDIAFTGERGFSGLFWRMQDGANYEDFYLRPHQSGFPDATQYTPVFNGLSAWQLYHGPGFSAPVALPPNEWVHIKLVVSGTRGEIYVNSDEPVVFMPELLRGASSGSIGLKASELTPAWYSNVSYEATTAPSLRGSPPAPSSEVEGVIRSWNVSSAFSEDELDGRDQLVEAQLGELQWSSLETGPTGITNLAQVAGRTDDANTVLARVRLRSEREQTIRVPFGYSDRVRVFVNDVLVYSGNNGYRSRDFRYLGTIGFFDEIAAALKAGTNELTFAVSESFGGWGILARIPESEGVTIEAP